MSKHKHINAMLETLYGLGREYGVQVTEPASGHFQLRGGLLVNYYPASKNQTAYVDGTKQGKHGVSPMEAIQMAQSAPPVVPPHAREPRRGKDSRERRQWLIARGHTTCHWCDCELSLDNSTLEHVISLARGGIDQPNNWKLACYPCNQDRGHDMPELSGNSEWVSPACKIEPVVLTTELIDYPQASEDELVLRRRLKSYEGKSSFLKDLLLRRDEGLALPQQWPAAKIERELSKVKKLTKQANREISEFEATRYHATFRSVAKDLLDGVTLKKLEAEVLRRQLQIKEA